VIPIVNVKHYHRLIRLPNTPNHDKRKVRVFLLDYSVILDDSFQFFFFLLLGVKVSKALPYTIQTSTQLDSAGNIQITMINTGTLLLCGELMYIFTC
jgi:hypothetical protein